MIGLVMHTVPYNLPQSPNNKNMYMNLGLTKRGRHNDAHVFIYAVALAQYPELETVPKNGPH